MYVVTVEFHITPENLSEFKSAMQQQAQNSMELEERCRHFDVCVSEKDPNHIFLYELYDDRAAFDLHLQSEHFLKFDSDVKDWVLEKKVATWLL